MEKVLRYGKECRNTPEAILFQRDTPKNRYFHRNFLSFFVYHF